MRFTKHGYVEIGLQCCPILTEQNNSQRPRYSAKGHHILDITARPRPLSVTESIALPPRPQAVDMSSINKFSIREWLVPPVVVPLFLLLMVLASVLFRS